MMIPPLRFCAINLPEAIRKIPYYLRLPSRFPPIAPEKREDEDSADIIFFQFPFFSNNLRLFGRDGRSFRDCVEGSAPEIGPDDRSVPGLSR